MIHRFSTIGIAILFFAASPARAGLITFEDGAALGGLPIGNNYAAQGVSFSNGIWVTPAFTGFSNNEFWEGAAGLGVENGVQTPNPWAFPGTTSPILISFTDPQISVSIDVFDIGVNGVRLQAFDVFMNLLGSDQALGSGAGFFNNATLAVSQPGIQIVALDQFNYSGFPDGIGWDNLSFTPASAPEPSSLALVSLSLAAIAIGRRRIHRTRCVSQTRHTLRCIIASRRRG